MGYYVDSNKALFFDDNKNIVDISNVGLRAFLEAGGVLVDIAEPVQQVLIISNFQMHMSLAQRGLYDAVINVIESLPETLHHEALVLFHKAPVAHSNNPLVVQILDAIGLDEGEQKELFEFALTIKEG